MKNILLAVCMIVFVTVAFAQDGSFHLDKEYRINRNGLIDLSSSDAKVFITGSRRVSAHVKIDRTMQVKGWGNQGFFTVAVEEADGNLVIKERKEGADVSFGSIDEEYKITIEAPEGISIKVRGDDGDYFVKNINGFISLSLDDADAELIDCKGEDFMFRIDDGDIRMNGGKGKLELGGDDADVTINKGEFSSINVRLDDGDLTMETSLADEGPYHISLQDGSLALYVTSGGGTFNIQHDDGSINSQPAFHLLHEDEQETHLSLANGKARISIKADDANVKLATR